MKTKRITAVSLTLAAAIVFASIHAQGAPKKKKPQAAQFSYYLLSLSFAPDFCAQKGGTKDIRECGTGRHIGFVVHGLWPQSDTGEGPQKCGPSSPVSSTIIAAMLSYIPTESLIQHEWATHGTCSGLSVADYFALVRKARDSVTIPADLGQPAAPLQLSQDDIESKMATANPSFPKDAFRLSCYPTNELQELRVCFNKDLSARACTASAQHCTANTVTLRQVR